MAAGDALEMPIKGVAYRRYFWIRNITTGQAWSGAWTTPAGTISKDGGNFASTTNTPVQVQTGGYGYVDLTATEMNADNVGLRIHVADANAEDVLISIDTADYYLPATDATNKAVLIQDGTGTGQIDTASGKVRLASDGMAGVAPANVDVAGRQTTYDGIISQLYNAEFNQHSTSESGGVVTERVYASDSTTVIMSGTVTQVDTNSATKGKMS